MSWYSPKLSPKPQRLRQREAFATEAAKHQLAFSASWRSSVPSPSDDISLQGKQNRGQLPLLPRRNAVFIERASEILYESVEIGIADAETAMRSSHAAAAVPAWTTTRLADLLNQQTLEARDVCGAEETIDTPVLSNVLDKVFHDQPDGRLASEPAIERAVMHRRLSGRRRKHDGDDAGCYAEFHLDKPPFDIACALGERWRYGGTRSRFQRLSNKCVNAVGGQASGRRSRQGLNRPPCLQHVARCLSALQGATARRALLGADPDA